MRKSPPAPGHKPRARSRTLLILVSCGLWLLYFDLVVAVPGCSDSSSNPGGGADAAVVDAPFASIDAPSDAPAVDAPVDAPGQDADATLGDAASDSGADALADASDGESGSPDAGCTPIVISQVYPGGGEAAAPYANDFVDIFNRTNADLDLTGYSLQVNDGTSTGAWTVIPLSGTLFVSHYATIILGGGAQGGQAVTGEIATGTFNLPTIGGRVSLVGSQTPLTGSNVGLDSVAYGTATSVEGTPATISQGAVARKINGCQDTNVNGTDFTAIAPNPRFGVTGSGCVQCQ